MIIFVAGDFSTYSITLTNRLEESLGLKAHGFKSGSGIGHLNIRINSIKLKLLSMLNKKNIQNTNSYIKKQL